MSLKGRRSRRISQDIPLDQFLALETVFQSLSEGVSDAMTLEFQGSLLKCTRNKQTIAALASVSISMDILHNIIGERLEEEGETTYGAAVVSRRICRFFRSCTSGRCASRRSNELRSVWVGEMEDSSTGGGAIVLESVAVARWVSRAGAVLLRLTAVMFVECSGCAPYV